MSSSSTPEPPDALQVLRARIGSDLVCHLPSIDGITVRIDTTKTDYLAYTICIGEFTPQSLYSTYSAWAHVMPGGLQAPKIRLFVYDDAHKEQPTDLEHCRPFQVRELWEDMDMDDEFQECQDVRDAEALVLYLFVMASTKVLGCWWLTPNISERVVERLRKLAERFRDEEN